MNIGERVSGRYKIIDQIGSGGMANVYLAKDLILERKVAVKMISIDFQDDQDSLRRFQREALSTTELIHPNIVSIYDVGEGDRPYIVMEYVEGMDLKQYIYENHSIPYQKILDIMDQILDGIAYAHKNDVIHRDIKPHNILIDHEGNIKITDFGIAVALSQNSITQTNSLLGSVQYISPEQARGNIVTKQSDIYSLGIVLYELLTGSVPFDGESAVSIALKHFQTTIPSLREFDSRVPQALENVVLKSTAKEPMNRYDNVIEMKEDLKTALSPDRRGEEKFVPLDLDSQDTVVLDSAAINEASKAEETPPPPPEKPNNPDGEGEKPPKKKKKRWWLLLLPLVIAIIIVVYLLSQPGEVAIPKELIGLEERDAIALLEEYSLELGEVIEQSNDEVEEGLVFRSDPDTGATVREGSEVDLYVSLGEEPFTMEDYVGESYEEVRATLDELGFEVEMEEDSSEEYTEGSIIEQDIDPGEEVIISQTTITFTVSTGRPEFTMRDLDGYSRASVQDYVSSLDLDLTAEEESSDDVPLGQVISQEPAAKTTIHAGDPITVVFSTGPEKKTDIAFSRQISLPYEEEHENSEDEDADDEDPDDEESDDEESNDEDSDLVPNKIEIYIEDLEKDMDTVAHELSITEDTPYFLNFVVEEGKSAKYRVDRDGETIIEETVSPD